MNADSQRAIPSTLSHPFGPGWNTGEYSAGLPAGGNARPDYVTVGGQSTSGAGSLAINLHDGTTYLSGGVVQNDPRSISWKPGYTTTAGWIIGGKDAEDTKSFLNGNGNQAYVSVPTPWKINVVGAITHSYGGGYAIELGIATPGKPSLGIVPITHATPIYAPNK
jgi:hypothetical protein